MSLKFERSKVSVEIYGEKLELRKPTFGESVELSKKIKENGGEENSTEIIMQFLESLGLPKQLLQSMEAEHVVTLLEHISGKKKT